ncbi:hypothetical protein CCAX7_22110 [Capsulimonas corticalis]|uniref:Uncharacterized protein n=1 Tax=Capsulimonas corticalis TaxID=2219043 RepID=A0A402D298_9BACT|nr:hypothetical protein [Capsulimonas corticalis]BDI30160.1 hypothetical protein CCAX7_22110 [Capsulimonas corticalis]
MLIFYGVLIAVLALLSGAAKVDIIRSILKLSLLHCPVCENAYGRAAALSARKKYIAQCDAAQRSNPECMINFTREWEVRCPVCASTGYYGFETNVLTVQPLLGPLGE